MPNVTTCESCGAVITPEDAVYDDRASVYYCDSRCFHDWADAHFDEVTAYYERMNVR